MFKKSLHKAIEYGHKNCIKALLEKQTLHFKKNVCEKLSHNRDGMIPNGLNAVDIAKHFKWRNRNQYKIIKYLEQFTSFEMLEKQDSS